MIATCTNCGTQWELKSVNPNRTHARYCSKPECQRASAKMRSRYWDEKRMKPKGDCKHCGEPVSRRGSTYCSKRECQNEAKRVWVRKRKSKPAETSWNIMGEAVIKQLYNAWVNGKSIHCETCRFYDHCQQRVAHGTPVACERWDKRDMELLQINPAYDKIQSLLLSGMEI